MSDNAELNGVGGSSYINVNLTAADTQTHIYPGTSVCLSVTPCHLAICCPQCRPTSRVSLTHVDPRTLTVTAHSLVRT